MTKLSGQPEILAVTEFLSCCLPFDQLSAEERAEVARSLTVAYYRRGHIFIADNEAQYGLRILRSGAVEIRSPDGQLLDRLGEAESFNIAGLDAEYPGVKAVLIEDCLVYCLPEPVYQQWRSQHRFFDRFFHGQRSRRLRRAARYEPDTNAMLRPITEMMSSDLVSVQANTSIRDTAQLMSRRRVSSIMILMDDELCGIVTDRDFRSRVVAEGVDVGLPITAVMTEQPFSINSEATLFDATLQMTRKRCHHLPVMDDGCLVGIITASDLMLAKRDDPVYLVQHIYRQADVDGMKNVVSSLPNIMQGWVASGVRPNQISRILTAISDAITQRLIQLAINHLGEAPVPFAWLGFGSQARAEQLLGADQDNGLIIDNSMQPEHQQWFKSLAHFVCDGLNLCGYPYCQGEIMATTDKWRQNLSGWRQLVDSWTRAPTAEAVMRVSIFFDIRVIYGDESLGLELQQHMLTRTSSHTIFLAALAANVLTHTPPLGIFRRFLVERSGEHHNSLDLKKRGVIPIIDMVRIHALANGVSAVNTRERIQALIEKKAITLIDGRNLQDAFDYIMQLRVQNQAAQIINGEQPDNYCKPKDLADLPRQHLRDAFTVVHEAQESIRLSYRGGLG